MPVELEFRLMDKVLEQERFAPVCLMRKREQNKFLEIIFSD